VTIRDAAAAPRIDLNADVGEGFDDAALVPLVTSASVACGGHAGDDAGIRATVRIARAHGVAVGAHPGFADRASFGRRVTTRDAASITRLVAQQVEHLAALAAREGVTLVHVKPHGALYNLSAVDRDVADAIAAGVARVLPGTALVGLAASTSLDAARDAGLTPIGEAFVDRGYLGDRTLAPRDRSGALLEDVHLAAARAVALATGAPFRAVDGTVLHVVADTLCLHGDTPDAVARARAVRAALRDAGVRLAAPGDA
jgi:5-oxoprolinase (ATP-hydrolysing) subunit A